MGPRYLVDTNIIIKLATENALKKASIDFLKTVLDDSFNLSVISKIELLSKDDKLLSFIETSNVIPLTEVIVEKTIELRRKYKIKIPDAIIASTAIINNFELITADKDDFRNIKGLILKSLPEN
jgi:predicted nucleic acid-binding protein